MSLEALVEAAAPMSLPALHSRRLELTLEVRSACQERSAVWWALNRLTEELASVD